MESSVKKLLIPLLLGLAFAGNVEAAPPTPAQIDRLLQVMDAQKVIDQMVPAMMQATRTQMEQLLDRNQASQADRDRMQRILAAQEASVRDMLSWDKLKPLYVRVYSDTMTADEVLAMTRFYESPEGRSVMQKMPQILQRTMQEMQPLAESAVQEMMDEIEAEIGDEKPAGE